MTLNNKINHTKKSLSLLAYLKVVFIIISSFIIISCGSGERNIDNGLKTQELHIGNGTEPQDIDPHVITGVPESKIVNALFEGLTNKDPKTLKPLPGVAKSWNISEDKKTYTFHLRDNAKWSNGDIVTANDFVYAWRRMLSPALGASNAYMLYYIKNAERYHKEKISDFNQVGVKAIDDFTLQVSLKNPTHFFLELLSHYSHYPVHKATIEKFGEIDEQGTRWTRQENIVGNGAFSLEKWKLNRIITVKKNPNYWNSKQVKLNKVHFHPIEDQNSEERMFRSRQLHITESIPVEKISKHLKESPEITRLAPYLGTYYYRFNTTKKPFDDVRIRKALAMSIDREQITQKISKAGEKPAYFFTPPNTKGYTAETKLNYDIQAAQKLLTEAGYPNGENFPTIELLYNTQENHRKIAIAIQQMWKQNLNINVQLLNQEWKVFLDNTKNLNYGISRAGWIADFVDPSNFLKLFVSDGGNNRTGWSNQTYDTSITQSLSAVDNQQRYQIFQQAETILMDEVPIIPIYFYSTKRLISTDVKNFDSNLLNFVSLTDIYLSREEK
jgi:oligopeptide transport system substrate-binding protein